MGGFSILNVPDYQRRFDILASITPFRPGMFIYANQDDVLRLCDNQLEIAEEQLKIWTERHPEDGLQELKCKIVDANPLTVKILEFDVDHEQQVIHEKWIRKQEKRRYWEKQVRKERRVMDG
jgi:hypothetical protein